MIDFDVQEELARKRQLPVPPMPRKGGVIARSEDNVSGSFFVVVVFLFLLMSLLCLYGGVIARSEDKWDRQIDPKQ